MAQQKHDALPEILDEAKTQLPPAEYRRAVRDGEKAGEKASTSESWRWLLALAIGAGVVAAIFFDWRVLIPTAALMLFYSIPLIVAARMTASDGAEAAVVGDRIEHPSGRSDAGAPAAPVPSQRLDQIPRSPRP